MTDRETLIAMFDKAGVIWEDVPLDPKFQTQCNEASQISVIADHGPKNFGYFMFSADFYFDEDEALLGVGAWE